MSDDTARAWASILVDVVNDIRTELRVEAALTRAFLERIELATNLNTVVLKEMQVRLSLLETAIADRGRAPDGRGE